MWGTPDPISPAALNAAARSPAGDRAIAARLEGAIVGWLSHPHSDLYQKKWVRNLRRHLRNELSSEQRPVGEPVAAGEPRPELMEEGALLSCTAPGHSALAAKAAGCMAPSRLVWWGRRGARRECAAFCPQAFGAWTPRASCRTAS